MTSTGLVYLVGAGPGDPGLITVKGLEILRAADVVLHDRLSSSALLAEAPLAEIINVGKVVGGKAMTQERIHALIIQHARQGKVVVRLKGGDPFVFGRGFEEFETCRDAGIDCIVIPGVTSAIAVPGSIGVPVTQRGLARSFAVVTGRVASGEPDHDYGALAQVDTLVLLMGRGNLPAITRSLIDAGRAPSTPVVSISSGTTANQLSVRATLATIADALDQAELPAPIVTVVGETANFSTEAIQPRTGARPLAGRRVAITQANSTSGELRRRLVRAGATLVHCPLIEITYPDRSPWLEAALAGLELFDFLVFTSVHGVRGFWDRLERSGLDARAIGRVRIAVLGPGTARELESHGVKADLVPRSSLADCLVRELPARFGCLDGKRVLFPHGNLALPTVGDGLRALGADVLDPIVYETAPAVVSDSSRALLASGLDAILFCSPSAARNFSELDISTGDCVIGCIGPTTADEAISCGMSVDVVPESPGSGHLVEALEAHFSTSVEVTS